MLFYLLVALVVVLPVALLGALACGKDLLALAIAVPTVALHAWAWSEANKLGDPVGIFLMATYGVMVAMSLLPASMIGTRYKD